MIKRELTTVVIAKYELLNDVTKSTILSVLCLAFQKRMNECFKNVFRNQLKSPVYSERKIETKLTRSSIVSILYLLYTAK